MAISETKKKIVIDNYFKEECTVDTSIREAFAKGFEIGLKKGIELSKETIDNITWNRTEDILPPEEEPVEITILDEYGDTICRYVSVGWYYEGFWVVNNEICHLNIIAWKPFSKAYEGE